MRSLKILSKRTYIVSISAILLVLISPLFNNFVSAADLEQWDDSGYIDAKGHRFSERILFSIENSGELTYKPVKIMPSFEPNRCAENSTRILQDIDNKLIELPYIIKNPLSSEGYLSYAEIIFVAIELPGNFYLVYSDNISIPAPDYSNQFLTAYDNEITNFYDPNTGTFSEDVNLPLNSAENQSRNILIPDVGDDEYMFMNITSAFFDLKMSSRFYEIGNLSYFNNFQGMGPASVRYYNGSVFDNPSTTYLLVGWPQNLTIYKNDSSSNWIMVDSVAVPDSTPGVAAQVSGMFIANVTDDDQYELVYGTKNGSVYVHQFNGNAIGSEIYNLRVTDGTNYWKNPYAITSVNITHSENAVAEEDQSQDLLIGGSGYSGYNQGRIQYFFTNNSEWVPGSITPLLEFGTDTNTNQSIKFYSQLDHYADQNENFFEGVYKITETEDTDAQEYMAVGVNPGTKCLTMGIYHPHRESISSTSIPTYSRLKKSTPQGDLGYYDLLQASGGTIAYSKNFNPNQISHSVIAAGYYNKLLNFKWFNFTTVEPSNLGDLNTGYMTLVENPAIQVPNINYPVGKVSLGAISGNIDGLNPELDDAVFVDSYGRFYFLSFNETNNNMEITNTNFLISEGMDLYGTGQSLDALDYNFDGKAEVVVGDCNGIVHFMNYSNVQDVNIWVNNSLNIINISENPGLIPYYSNIRKTDDFGDELNKSIGKNIYFDGFGNKYWNTQVDVGAETASNIDLMNLTVRFDTNNYSLMVPNQFPLGSFDPFLSDESDYPRQFSDLDGDGLWDYYEARGIIAWDPDDPIFNVDDNGNPLWGSNRLLVLQGVVKDIRTTIEFQVYIGDKQSITVKFLEPIGNNPTNNPIRTDPFKRDTDGDGIGDGLEILIFQTHPNRTDTDGDYLNDYDEIYNSTYLFRATNADTDGDRLSDKAEWEFGSDPTNENTNGDSISFYSKNYKEERTVFLTDREKVDLDLNPCLKDTDGDGLSDLQELGLWNSSDSKSVLLNNLKSDNRGLQYYAKDTTYIDEFYSIEPANMLVTGLDPLKFDTDDDGLNDYEEIFGVDINGTKYFTDPTKPDTDGDGLIDAVELFGWTLDKNIPGIQINYTIVNIQGNSQSFADKFVLDPDNKDMDNDRLLDGEEILPKNGRTNPIASDTDGDGLLDGEEFYGFTFNDKYSSTELKFSPSNPTLADTDQDGLIDGEEVYGIILNPTTRALVNRDYYYFIVITFNPSLSSLFGTDETNRVRSDPTLKDTDGDTISDFDEVTSKFTNPASKDTDADGIPDNEDQYPVLNKGVSASFIVLIILGGVGSVVAIPLNRYSATKALARKYLYQEKIKKSTSRMARERKEARPFSVRANSIPTEKSDVFRVKITMEIKDSAFFGRAARVSYSAGTSDFTLINAEKIEQEKYVFTLDNIPVDERVIYFVEFLDKGGIWVRDDNDGKFYQFATNKDGSIDSSDDDEWKVEHGVKCPVCGYLCQRTWDECPECGTKLFDDASLAITQDDKKIKEEAMKRETDAEKIAWEEAQQTDEVWRGLPTCPGCGIAVQPDWAACPVCQYDLSTAKLKKDAAYAWEEIDADYMEGKEEGEIKTEYENDVEKVKSEKEILDEIDQREKKKKQDAWQSSDNDGDIL